MHPLHSYPPAYGLGVDCVQLPQLDKNAAKFFPLLVDSSHHLNRDERMVDRDVERGLTETSTVECKRFEPRSDPRVVEYLKPKSHLLESHRFERSRLDSRVEPLVKT